MGKNLTERERKTASREVQSGVGEALQVENVDEIKNAGFFIIGERFLVHIQILIFVKDFWCIFIFL